MNKSVNTLFWTTSILTTIVCIPISVAHANESTTTDDHPYVYSAGSLLRSGSNLCYRTGFWTPAGAIPECDPDLVKKVEVKPAEKIAAIPTQKPTLVKPIPRKIELSADTLFDFDKSILRPAGKEKLDDLDKDLAGVNYDVIVVVGHTDRIGSAAYNQKLSERRANAVKAYMESKGIATDRIKASGKGKSEPKTTPSDCKGKRGKMLLACLQPDRRVEVSIEGTKDKQ